LAGGETAVVPEIVKGVDLGGTAIGFFPRGRTPVTGSRVRPGDLVIGVPSRGFHANGFTLVRRLLREKRVDLQHPRRGGRVALGHELLAPGRIYVDVSEALADRATTHGFAHISGGGVRNLVRLNPEVRFELDGWPRPSGVFEWARQLGEIEPRELYQTFNMGIGFAAIVSPRSLTPSLQALRTAGVRDARAVGRVVRGHGVVLPQLGLEYTGYG
jgi:phosphoribosylformylglycinamidine cyclo-ligase